MRRCARCHIRQTFSKLLPDISFAMATDEVAHDDVRFIMTRRSRPDLFAPALAQAGLHHNRVIYVEADRDEDVLTNFEEGLRFGGLGAVVAELVRLPMTASRRLQLAEMILVPYRSSTKKPKAAKT